MSAPTHSQVNSVYHNTASQLRIMKAAPCMLAALQAVLSDCRSNDTESYITPIIGLAVMHAIAEATGRPA